MKKVIKMVKRIDREDVEGFLLISLAFVEFYCAMWLCAILRGY